MKVKGLAIKNSYTWLKNNKGENAWNTVLENLSPKFRDIIEGGEIDKDKWYPFKLFININECLVEHFNNGDHRLIKNIAKKSAEQNFNTVYKIYLKMATPEKVAEKASEFYQDFYNFGNLQVMSNDSAGMKIALKNVPREPVFFERICGYLEGVLEMTRVHSVRVYYRYKRKKKKVIITANFIR